MRFRVDEVANAAAPIVILIGEMVEGRLCVGDRINLPVGGGSVVTTVVDFDSYTLRSNPQLHEQVRKGGLEPGVVEGSVGVAVLGRGRSIRTSFRAEQVLVPAEIGLVPK